MSGTNNHNCRIGKVTLKPAVIKAEMQPRAPGRVRGMFVEAIRALDENVKLGVTPIVGFFALVNTDGTISVETRMNKEATEEEMNKLNWRHLTMLFEDLAQDCRNFSVYNQRTTYDLINVVAPEEDTNDED